ADLLRGLHEKQARFWFMTLSDPAHMENVYDDHLALIDALERRDVPQVREIVRHHVDEFRKTIIRSV
ncbi:MAG TPA: FCD domain-containing protein, partial [Bordetella sp.]